MKIAMIAAVAENNAIGINNKMPWYLPGDLRYFKAVTMGKPIIMAAKPLTPCASHCQGVRIL